MLFLFIIFNGYSSERLAIIVQVISWIIEVDFQGGRCTVNFVMIQHADGNISLYAHLYENSITVSAGVDCEETGAQGVAIAAGIGAGVYKDYEDAFEKAVKVKEPVLPDDSTFPIYEKRYKEWCRLNEIMKTYWDEKSKG